MTLLHRDDFGTLIDSLQLRQGVELGVSDGRFSDRLLSYSRLDKLTGIDKWNDERHPAAQQQEAARRLVRHGARSHLVHRTFEEALPLFPDRSLDFVYVDGYAHTGQEGGRTLAQWWEKVRPGGIMAGHDYHVKWLPTVRAVNRFASEHDLPLYLTSGDEYPSWYVFKPPHETRGGEPLMPAREDCPIASGRSCILVGNGPSLEKQGLGARIDAFDEAVRFNNFTLQGHEADTGARTTLWATGGRNRVPAEEPWPKRMLFVHGQTGNPGIPVQELWRIPLSFYEEQKQRVYWLSRRPTAARAKLLPSTGLVVATWLLQQGVPQLTLAGFDHFKAPDGRHHLGDPKQYATTHDHDSTVEAAVFRQLQESGRIAYLNS